MCLGGFIARFGADYRGWSYNVFCFSALNTTPVAKLMSTTGETVKVVEDSGAIAKFNRLNETVMHMGSNPAMPWCYTFGYLDS